MTNVGTLARWFLPSIGSFCLLLILYLLIFNSWRLLLDSDTGWHIRTGELILQMRSVPREDPFSHTMGGQEWFAWEWLADVMMALAHNRLGLAGVVIGAILVLLLSYAALYRSMMWRGSDPIIALVLTIFAALCSIVHWLARPHLLSIALMLIWCAVLESYRRHGSRWIYFVPLLIVPWANLHGAFISAFAVLAVYGIGDWLESKDHRRVLRTYGLVGALCALAALATPFGFKLYLHLASYLTDKQLLSSIQEFQSPNFHSTDGKLIELLLLLGAIAAVNAIRQRRFVETGLLLLWGHLTLQSERHVTLAAVVLSPIIAEQLTLLAAEVVERLSQGGQLRENSRAKAFCAMRDWYRGTMEINRRLTGGFVYAAVLIFIIMLATSSRAARLLSPRFNPNRFPIEAADFILQTKPAGRMFAHDQFGGYLIYRLYPHFKVFVDGRSDFYRRGTVLEDVDQITLIKPRWAELLDKYNVQWMVLERGEPLVSIALLSGQWESVYEDRVAQVLIKKSLPRPVEK